MQEPACTKHALINCCEAEPHNWNCKLYPHKKNTSVYDKTYRKGAQLSLSLLPFSPNLKNCSSIAKSFSSCICFICFCLWVKFLKGSGSQCTYKKRRLPCPLAQWSSDTSAAQNRKEIHQFTSSEYVKNEMTTNPLNISFKNIFSPECICFKKKSQIPLLQPKQ